MAHIYVDAGGWKLPNKCQSAKSSKLHRFHATCWEGAQVDGLRSHGGRKRQNWKYQLPASSLARSGRNLTKKLPTAFSILSLPRFLDKVIFDSLECIIVSVFLQMRSKPPPHWVNVKISCRILCIKYVFINLNLQQSWRSWQILFLFSFSERRRKKLGNKENWQWKL